MVRELAFSFAILFGLVVALGVDARDAVFYLIDGALNHVAAAPVAA
jgi:hypothetical protein